MSKPMFDAQALISMFENATAQQGAQLRKGDHVVRRKDAHHGVGVQLADQGGGEADRGRRVALGRFSEDLALGHPRQLLDDLRTQRGIGQHEDALRRQHFLQPVNGLLDQRPVTGEAEHLL